MPKKKLIRTRNTIVGVTPEGEPIDQKPYDTLKGLYSFSLEYDPSKNTSQHIRTKIGTGGLQWKHPGGLLKRINSYSTCYPDGVWLFCLMWIRNPAEASKEKLKSLEKQVHQELRKYRYVSPWNTRLKESTSEWFDKVPLNKVRKAFKDVRDRNGGPEKLTVVYLTEEKDKR